MHPRPHLVVSVMNSQTGGNELALRWKSIGHDGFDGALHKLEGQFVKRLGGIVASRDRFQNVAEGESILLSSVSK